MLSKADEKYDIQVDGTRAADGKVCGIKEKAIIGYGHLLKSVWLVLI